MITVDDLVPGAVFDAPNQGTCITPQTIKVTVHWVSAGEVWYTKDEKVGLYATTLDRFLDIVNQKKEGNWYE